MSAASSSSRGAMTLLRSSASRFLPRRIDQLPNCPGANRPYSAAAAVASSSSTSSPPAPSTSQESFDDHAPSPSPSSNLRQRGPPPHSYRQSRRPTTPLQAQEYLSSLLSLPSTRPIPVELALQCLTHKSYQFVHPIRPRPQQSESNAYLPPSPYPATSLPPSLASQDPGTDADPSCASHNARLSFLGRRAIASYLAMFVHSNISSTREFNSVDFLRGKSLEEKLEDLRHVANLGREVGAKWRVGEVMRWDERSPILRTPTGQAKVRGMVVESVVGAVFLHYGSPAAQRAFHLHVLPHLSRQMRDPRLIEAVESVREGVRGEYEGVVLRSDF